MRILIASDIFGVTPDLEFIATSLCKNFLVVSPYSDEWPHFVSEEHAYESFLSCGGITSYTEKLAIQIQMYQPDAFVGFSVGATAGWIVLSSSVFSQAIQSGILFYGSRIRDYMHLRPVRPVKLIFAEYEKSVDARKLVKDLNALGFEATMWNGCQHGFMNQHSPGYDEDARRIGIELAKSAVSGMCNTGQLSRFDQPVA